MNAVISGSASLQGEMEKWRTYWEERKFDVLAWPIPIPAESFAKEWPEVHRKFYEALYQTDIVFVANEAKNGIAGYVGPNVFAEISFAVGLSLVRKKEIRILLLHVPLDPSPYGEALRSWMENGWVEIFQKDEL